MSRELDEIRTCSRHVSEDLAVVKALLKEANSFLLLASSQQNLVRERLESNEIGEFITEQCLNLGRGLREYVQSWNENTVSCCRAGQNALAESLSRLEDLGELEDSSKRRTQGIELHLARLQIESQSQGR
jgi:hypothetical protein